MAGQEFFQAMKAMKGIVWGTVVLFTVAAGLREERTNLSDVTVALCDSLMEGKVAKAHDPRFLIHRIISPPPPLRFTDGIPLRELNPEQRHLVYRMIAATQNVPGAAPYPFSDSVRVLNTILLAMKYPDSPSGLIDTWRFKIYGQPTSGDQWGFFLSNDLDHLGFLVDESSKGRAIAVSCSQFSIPKSSAMAGRFDGNERALQTLLSSFTAEQRALAFINPPPGSTNWPPVNLEQRPGIPCSLLSSNQMTAVEFLYDQSRYLASPKVLTGLPDWQNWDLPNCIILVSTNSEPPYQRYFSYRIGAGSGSSQWPPPKQPAPQSNQSLSFQQK